MICRPRSSGGLFLRTGVVAGLPSGCHKVVGRWVGCLADDQMRAIRPNHSVEANRRPAAPLHAGGQFGSPFSARPDLPAAVAHLRR